MNFCGLKSKKLAFPSRFLKKWLILGIFFEF